MVSFKVGDNAVYPGHGVGKVTAIETKEILGASHTFYSINILDSGPLVFRLDRHSGRHTEFQRFIQPPNPRSSPRF